MPSLGTPTFSFFGILHVFCSHETCTPCTAEYIQLYMRVIDWCNEDVRLGKRFEYSWEQIPRRSIACVQICLAYSAETAALSALTSLCFHLCQITNTYLEIPCQFSSTATCWYLKGKGIPDR
ncbi:Hypothetical predicted protein [Podarcis lilfordi]|uniref:Secreted protein n=1 Tax=Podarcis lilfordi TaxID=74358 RepID=A0AA35JWM6_9SAUR|nr:Hypothetical predicted protein [Podarcis lilfordi]